MKCFEFVAVMTLLALCPSIVKAGAMLDQSDTVNMQISNSGTMLGQTFTVGITGQLSSIDLLLYSPNGTPIDVMLATTASGVPTNTILGQSTIENPDLRVTEWMSFVFSPAISVYTGEVLAIELPKNNEWIGDGTASYAGGLAYAYDGTTDVWKPQNPFGKPSDFDFQTFVIPAPEPSSLTLLGSALSLLTGFRLLKRRRAA